VILQINAMNYGTMN